MKPVDFRYLSMENVKSLGLTMKDFVEYVSEVLSEHGKGNNINPKKTALHTVEDSFLHSMPGELKGKKAAGMKWVCGVNDNLKKGLPFITGVTIYVNYETAIPEVMMDCSWVTTMRTAAVSGVAVRHLAKKDSKTAGIIGAGEQGRRHIEALSVVSSTLEEVSIFDIREESIDSLIAEYQDQVSFKIKKASSLKEALNGKDILITCTGLLHEPIFSKEWIKEGALVLPIHSVGWDKDILQKMDKFLVDDWGQFSGFQNEKGSYYEGMVPDSPYAELGDVVAGNKQGRANDKEKIINHNYGLAVHDIYIAQQIKSLAEDKGVGIVLPLMESVN
jgi:ornithine cyclodeaminase/alanine dehydrogenase-like protein (mu-crystallin family)